MHANREFAYTPSQYHQEVNVLNLDSRIMFKL